MNSINPTVVMTDMGKLAWSDPAKANPMLARIPLGRFAGMLRQVGHMAYIQMLSPAILQTWEML